MTKKTKEEQETLSGALERIKRADIERELELNRIIYNLGREDAISHVLAIYRDKIRLPELAIEYKNTYDTEPHFSHQWHTGTNEKSV